jgi:hypothetical protein
MPTTHLAMIRMTASTQLAEASAESTQRLDDGTARFCVPADPGDPAWSSALQLESDGGVQAAARVFLDMQLVSGDLLLDLAPGFGFVALSAATAPNGAAAVFIAELDNIRLTLLQDAARDAGSSLKGLPSTNWEDIAGVLTRHLDADGRLFVHVASEQIADACRGVAALPQAAQFLALCVSDPGDPDEWPAIAESLADAGLQVCELVANDDEPILVPILAAPAGAFFALPDSLFTDDGQADAPSTEHPVAPSHKMERAPASHPVTWSAASSGFSFIAPHSRTGYGVTGANLLREFQAKGVPVAFFPIGGVDQSLTDNPRLATAVQAQENFPVDAPSVRLAQQFDLALHAGRGPRVAFTIFETNIFTPREMHHLRMQDAVLVCTPWAREVCINNGLGPSTVHVVPLGVDPTIYHQAVVARPRWKADETVFMQVGKLEARKGQLDLLRAFEAAFSPQDRVRLVLVCHNPFQAREHFDAALAPFRTSPMARLITLHTTELATSRDVAAMMAAADCGVFPARAEGWNLEALEMLAMGKPLIATNATAHTAFLNAANTRLINMGPPEPALGGRLPGSWPSWTEAQHEQLVHHLREAHAARCAGTDQLNVAGLGTAQRHTWSNSADALLTALQSVR